MWDLSFAVPSLLILAIFLSFYFSLPRLNVRRNRAFLRILIVETLVVTSGIFSSYVDNFYWKYSATLVILANMFYFITFYTRSFILYQFNESVLGKKGKDSQIISHLTSLPLYICVLIALSSFFSKAVFYIDEKGYHSGPFYKIIYLCSFFYLLISYLLVVLNRDKSKRKREWYSLFLYNFILMCGLVARMYFPKILLMDTFCIMAIIVVYLAFENPEYNLENGGIVFNSRALREYLEENLGCREYKYVGIMIHKYHEMRDIYGTRQMDEGVFLIARYFTQTFRGTEVFYYRKGRFIMLIPKGTDVREICRQIEERFRKAWRSKDTELYLEVGFITGDITKSSESADKLLNTMIYAFEKLDNSGGSEKIEVTEKEFAHIEQDTVVRKSLKYALEKRAVEVFLQPLINVESGRIEGAEALARIRDPQGNIISPTVFVPVAESSGRINELGEQVFEKTCEFIKDNDLEAMGIKWINVNLSPAQLMKFDLGERLVAIAQKYRVPTGKIHLEITEESMIDAAYLQRQMQLMEEKGFQFVLDDYGTGYSNLLRLKKCTFINIKIDKGLVWDYCRERDELLPTMVQTFKQMNFGITAEGIEDMQMAEEMQKIGCDYLQGFYYSKPVSMNEFAEKYKV